MNNLKYLVMYSDWQTLDDTLYYYQKNSINEKGYYYSKLTNDFILILEVYYE
jgi:hypothetical protein